MFPELTLESLKGYVNPDFYYTNDVLEILKQDEWKHLGWLNAGIKLPQGVDFEQIYANRSGSYCIYGNFSIKWYYCVDMG